MEDSGGPDGHARMLEILADPTHPEHEDLLAWCGGDVDFTQHDNDAINAVFNTIFGTG